MSNNNMENGKAYLNSQIFWSRWANISSEGNEHLIAEKYHISHYHKVVHTRNSNHIWTQIYRSKDIWCFRINSTTFIIRKIYSIFFGFMLHQNFCSMMSRKICGWMCNDIWYDITTKINNWLIYHRMLSMLFLKLIE